MEHQEMIKQSLGGVNKSKLITPLFIYPILGVISGFVLSYIWSFITGADISLNEIIVFGFIGVIIGNIKYKKRLNDYQSSGVIINESMILTKVMLLISTVLYSFLGAFLGSILSIMFGVAYLLKDMSGMGGELLGRIAPILYYLVLFSPIIFGSLGFFIGIMRYGKKVKQLSSLSPAPKYLIVTIFICAIILSIFGILSMQHLAGTYF